MLITTLDASKQRMASALLNGELLEILYASYVAMFCPLHSGISIEQHKKHLCNPSSYYEKYGRFTHDACSLNLDA